MTLPALTLVSFQHTVTRTNLMTSRHALRQRISMCVCLGVAFALVACCTGTAAADESLSAADELVYQGLDYADNGDKQKAIDCYTRAIRLDAQHVWAYHYRGMESYRQRQYRNAIDDLTKCLRLGQNHAEVFMFRGYAWGGLREYEKAIDDLSEAIKLSEHRFPKVWAYDARGDYLIKLRRHREAIADLTEAIRLDPKAEYTNEAYYNRAVAWSSLGNHKEAIQDFDNAIRYGQNSEHAYRYRAEERKKLGR